MALSDCPKCWDTPCTCGYMGYDVKYRPGPSQYERDQEKRGYEDRIARLEAEVKRLKENPHAP